MHLRHRKNDIVQQLNLSIYKHRIITENNKSKIFDIVRKKFVALTQEEWVRQNFIHFLIQEKKYPLSLIAVEMKIAYNKLVKRCDIVIYTNDGKPLMIVECKSTEVDITQGVFDQAMRYNMPLRVKYIAMTNGVEHYCCEIDYEKNKVVILDEFPSKI